jgi:lipoprotein-releasing system permease protein
MPFELFVAVRYLLARRKQTVLSFVTLISVTGVAAGVTALIIALALNTGFQQEFQDRILGATSHVNLLRLGADPIRQFDGALSRFEEIPGVHTVSPTIYGQAQLSSDLNRQRGVMFRGVDPEHKAVLDDLFRHLIEGDDTRFAEVQPVPSMIIGKELASELGVLLGDRVRALGMRGELSPMGMVPRIQDFRVVAIFESGLWDYDANWALIPMAAAQDFLGFASSEISALEFRIDDIYEAPKIAEAIQKEAGLGFTTQTWIELNRPLFSALKLEKLALFIAIGLIVLVASLNIVSTLTMTVMEKNRDIAIIGAMGGDAKTIMRIFMLQGLVIGLVGTTIGAVIGSAAVWYFDTYRVFHLEAEVYSIPYVPFTLAWMDVALISLLSVLVSFVATLYPARAAARLEPVEALRYE